MARRKTDAEVGVLGVWAYDTRTLLSLSDAQVADRAGVGWQHIRKIEGGSERNPSRRVVREMSRYFREIGERQGIPVDDPPGAYLSGALAAPPNEVPDAYLARIDALVAELQADRTLIRELLGRLSLPELAQDQAGARAKVADLEDDARSRLLPFEGEPRTSDRETASTVPRPSGSTHP